MLIAQPSDVAAQPNGSTKDTNVRPADPTRSHAAGRAAAGALRDAFVMHELLSAALLPVVTDLHTAGAPVPEIELALQDLEPDTSFSKAPAIARRSGLQFCQKGAECGEDTTLGQSSQTLQNGGIVHCGDAVEDARVRDEYPVEEACTLQKRCRDSDLCKPLIRTSPMSTVWVHSVCSA